SSSPLIRTTCLPLPRPSEPWYSTHGSAPAARPPTRANESASGMRVVHTRGNSSGRGRGHYRDPTAARKEPRSDDLLDRLGPFHADQLLVEPAVEIAQFVRVEPQLRQDGGVQV